MQSILAHKDCRAALRRHSAPSPQGALVLGRRPMIGKLNHVGVATPSIEQSWKLYREVMGVTDITEKRALPEQGVWVSFVNLPNAQIELIEPYGEDSPIHGFLAKNPRGGQHHVCFEVEDIYAA